MGVPGRVRPLGLPAPEIQPLRRPVGLQSHLLALLVTHSHAPLEREVLDRVSDVPHEIELVLVLLDPLPLLSVELAQSVQAHRLVGPLEDEVDSLLSGTNHKTGLTLAL